MQVFFFLFRCQKTVKVTHFERQRSNFDMMMMITILLLGDIFSDVYICCTYEGNSQRKQIKPDHSCVLTYVLYGDNFSDQSTYGPRSWSNESGAFNLYAKTSAFSYIGINSLFNNPAAFLCHFHIVRFSALMINNPCAESNLNNRQKCLFDRVLRNCVDNDDDHAFLSGSTRVGLWIMTVASLDIKYGNIPRVYEKLRNANPSLYTSYRISVFFIQEESCIQCRTRGLFIRFLLGRN